LLASLILSTLAAVFLAPYLIDLLRVLRQLVEPFAHNP
jgi:hypothetical protein